MANVTAVLTAAINANGTVNGDVTASDGTTLVTITSDVAGTSFTIAASAANLAAVAQVITVTPASVTEGETLIITINSVNYSYVVQTGDAVADATAGLVAATSATGITDADTGTAVTLTANVAGTKRPACCAKWKARN